ncbi:MAG: hypothetical protein ACXWSD_05785 [Bdellovibrionota bacterium]
MNTMKYFVGIFAAVFFFAFGITFHAFLPNEGSNYREPASISNAGPHSNAKFDGKATAAFKTCLDSKVKNGSVDIGKVVVEGRKWSIVSIPCQGEAAKELYNAIQPYSSEEYVHYRDQRRGVVRFFGRLFPPSQCVQLIGTGKGKEINEYSCSIRIDVDSEITEQLKL